MTEPILEARSISKRFGPIEAVNEVNLSVDSAEIVALVGENGAGKSTVLRMMAGDERPDSGTVLVRGTALTGGLQEAQYRGVGMVWQDLALCDNLDAAQNLFLGQERGGIALNENEMRDRTLEALAQVGISIADLSTPVGRLPAGQRQAVALARAMYARPSVLLLDEPTASLGVAESRMVGELMRRSAAEGTGILFVTHNLDEVFRVADRVVVMRQGMVTASASRQELNPDDLAALISGVRVDTTASQQLRVLYSLVDQLAAADPSVALPLTVTAMANALSAEMLSVFLTDPSHPGELVRSAVIGLSGPLLTANRRLPVGDDGGSVGRAAEQRTVVVVEDVRTDPLWAQWRDAAVTSGVRSTWAAPIIGQQGVIGVVAGYSSSIGRPREDQLDLAALFAGQAAAVMERAQLITDLSDRNRRLETIRGVLQSLSGPDARSSGIPSALLALCLGTGASATAIYDLSMTPSKRRVIMYADPGSDEALDAAALLDSISGGLTRMESGRVHRIGSSVAGVRFSTPDGESALLAAWTDPAPGDGWDDLLPDAARSLRIAYEREHLEAGRQESEALRRSNDLQRSVIMRLSHELRTPLTAIHGFSTSLRQPDVEWRVEDRDRFLAGIATESERMIRLVDDLIDSSVIEAGILRLAKDWCDLGLVIRAAVDVVAGASEVTTVDVPESLPAIWADHDRLKQVFVNLLANAIRHNEAGTKIRIELVDGLRDEMVVVRVSDDGKGLPQDLMSALLSQSIGRYPNRGLGLKIATGVVESHAGMLVPELVSRGTSLLLTLPAEPKPGETDDENS